MLTNMQDVVAALRAPLIDWLHHRHAELVGETHVWECPADPVHARRITVEDNGLYLVAERDGKLLSIRADTDPGTVLDTLRAWQVLPQVIERSNGRHAASEVTP